MSELRRLFELVCDLPESERLAALHAAGADETVIAHVIALLRADASTRTLAREPVASVTRELVESTELGPGDRLDAWRLVREIGHGGMGAVYLAERADGAFEQHAAIKLIRGIADEAMISRFTRERQLLAKLRHPQIARLLDGGTTPGGQPYLVMEYVEGHSLRDWCDQMKPALAQRLALIASIARAVQHAHRQLIVHCDLKPSNLIVRADGEPVLLDFGVAQVLNRSDQAGSEARRYVTPRYASPEQLSGGPPGIATDIFALGLLLGELVTDRALQRDTATAPSAITATLRPSELAPRDLPWLRQLRGDIDAIVERACAHDPAQRYSSADALADDIERIGRHQPVAARRASWHYVGARLVRRRWPAFAGLALTLAVSGFFMWRTLEAERTAQREAATAQRVSEFLVSVFAASDSNLNKRTSHALTAREVLDQGAQRIHTDLRQDPEVRARLLSSLGDAYRHMGLEIKAAPLLKEAAGIYLTPAVNQPLAAATVLTALANTYANGEFPAADAEHAARESLRLWQEHKPGESVDLANARMVLALALSAGGKFDEALATAKITLDMLERIEAPRGRINVALSNLGMISSRRGDPEAAKGYYLRALESDREAGLADTGGFALRLNNYAAALERNSELVESIKAQREALHLGERFYGADGGYTTGYRVSLARKLSAHGDYAEALAELETSLAYSRRLYGDESTEVFNVQVQIASIFFERGEFERALPLYRAAHTQRRAAFPPGDPRNLRATTLLCRVLLQLPGGAQEAGELLPAAIAAARPAGEGGIDIQAALAVHASVLVANRRYAEAQTVLKDIRNDAKAELWTRVRVSQARADLARAAGDAVAAANHTESAWQLLHAKLGPEHPQTARFAMLLARELQASDAARAERLITQAKPIVERAFPAASAHRRAT